VILRLLGAILVLAAGIAQAQSPETLTWLRKISAATQRLSYSGIFVYQNQNGTHTETSRITRYVDASGDIEKLEALDGVPREIVRTNDTVRRYLPDRRLVKVDRRAERGFPAALLPQKISALARHYDISLGETRRIAGFDCRAVLLTPKDDLRYGYRLCADVKSGVLMRAVTVDPAGAPVEQFTFTQLAIGGVTRAMVRPRNIGRDWRVEDAGAAPARLAGWSLAAELPGFHKVVELKRRLGESREVGQMVYSDGLAAISVFIEPLAARQDPVRTGLASMGAINIYTREVANHVITVVGEAPALSVQRVADAVEFRQPQ